MKRIAFFISSLGFGGAERVVSRLSTALKPYYRVYIFVINKENQAYDVECEVIDLGGNAKNYYMKALHAMCNINSMVKAYEIDCVISFLSIPNLFTTTVVHGCRRIISVRNYYGKTDNKVCMKAKGGSPVWMLLDKIFYKRADAVIGITQCQGESLVREFHIPKEKLCIIENLYDIKEIENLGKEDIQEKAEEFFKEHLVAVTMGRLQPIKGHKILLEIFQKVLEQNARAGLIILGEGPLREQLKEYCRELKIEKHVLFMETCKNPFSYMSRARLFVSTSFREGFPNGLVEAMACGIPVMHSDCLSGPGEILRKTYSFEQVKTAEYVDYGVLLVDYGNLEGDAFEKEQQKAADIWCEILADNELQRQYAEKAKERATYYSYERCVKSYREVIEKR